MVTEVRTEIHIQEAINKIDSAACDRMSSAVNEVRNVTLETLSGQRTGQVYRLPGSGSFYTASAPGEAPATRLGDLKKSIHAVVEDEDGSVVGYVGIPKGEKADEYGPALEYGTSKIAARPWLRPSFEKSEEKVQQIFGEDWMK